MKGFYKEHFLRFDRQVLVLVDCLQPLNSGPQAFNDMRLAIDPADAKFPLRAAHLVSAGCSRPSSTSCCLPPPKPITSRSISTANMVSLLQQLIQDAWQNAAFEGISMDCLGLASIQATQSGLIEVNGEKIPALRG